MSTDRGRQLELLFKQVMRRLWVLDPDDPVSELPVAQLRVLTVLRQHSRTLTGLARELGSTTSAATQIADRLERAGLVERLHEGSDRRCKTLQLTPEGSALLQRREDKRALRSAAALELMGEERSRELFRSLQELLQAAEALPFGSEP